MKHKLILTVLLVFLLSANYGQGISKTFLFIGSYTDGKPGTGIFVYEFNNTTGELTKVSEVNNIVNPSFITISPNGKFLYACSETKLINQGSITAFGIDARSGKLSFINKQPSGGDNPVYLTVHKNNRFVVNANYSGGSVSVFSTNSDGSLNPFIQNIKFIDSSVNKTRQTKSYIHSSIFSPANDYIFLPDLGADKIREFRFDVSQAQPLVAVEPAFVRSNPGSGPRHFTFHPRNKYAYCIEEISGMISAYRYSKGRLDSIQRIFSYSKTLESYGGADIHISPDGKFLYASNRGASENTISIFSINPGNGKLSLVGHQSTFGDHPRNFTIDPTGKFLLVANMNTGNIVVFKRDVKTGLLTNTGNEILIPRVSCLQMRSYNIN